MTDFKVNRRGFFLLLASAVLLVCFAVIVWLLIEKIDFARFGYWPRVMVLVLFFVSLFASLGATEVLPIGSRKIEDWLKLKVLGASVLTVIAAISFVVGLIPLFDPPAATEQTARAILDVATKTQEDAEATREVTEGISAALTEAGLVARDRQVLAGLVGGVWGEPGCEVTFRLELTSDELSMRSINAPDGVPPLNSIGEIDAIRGSTVKTTTRFPIEYRGNSVEFTYVSSGTLETLIWNDRSRDHSVTLDRCNRE